MRNNPFNFPASFNILRTAPNAVSCSYPVVWCSVLVAVLQVDSIHAECINKVLAVLQPTDTKTQNV
jgi:hypothetical protein